MTDLREKVAEELWQADSMRVMGCRRSVPWSEAGPAAHKQWRPLADAAIALVLEEAARVAEEMSMNYDTMDNAPAAIRALKGNP
jgi:hypothetical protein